MDLKIDIDSINDSNVKINDKIDIIGNIFLDLNSKFNQLKLHIKEQNKKILKLDSELKLFKNKNFHYKNDTLNLNVNLKNNNYDNFNFYANSLLEQISYDFKVNCIIKLSTSKLIISLVNHSFLIFNIENKNYKTIDTEHQLDSLYVYDNDTLIAGSSKYNIEVYDLNYYNSLKSTKYKHDDFISSIIGLKSSIFASASYDNKINIWEMNSNSPISIIETKACVYSLININENIILSSHDNYFVNLWDWKKKTKLAQYETKEIKHVYNLLLINPDTIVCSGYGYYTYILKIKLSTSYSDISEINMKESNYKITDFGKNIEKIDDTKYAIAYKNGTITIWDINSFNYITELRKYDISDHYLSCKLTNTKFVFNCCSKKKLIIWNIEEDYQ